jgi:hypothetical protein
MVKKKKKKKGVLPECVSCQARKLTVYFDPTAAKNGAKALKICHPKQELAETEKKRGKKSIFTW